MHILRNREYTLAYTLIELSISLAVLAIIFTGLLGVFLKKDEAKRYKITQERIAIIQKAIADYADNYRALPCPAIGPTAETSSNFGYSVEYISPNCDPGANYVGMVPVRSLNLPDFYAYDGWERKFSYSIASGMGSASDVASGTYKGDIKIIDFNGASKTDLSRDYPNNYGAAYILISYGQTGLGAWLKNSTVPQIMPTTGGREYQNAFYNRYRKFIVSGQNYTFGQVIAYKTLPSLINLKYQRSPIRIPLLTCSNANAILNDPTFTYNNISNSVTYTGLPTNNSTTTAIKNIALQTAGAINNLCNNQPKSSLNSASSCGFSPKQISNLQTWFDGSDPAGTGIAPSDGTTVTTWIDKSGNGKNATMVSGTPQYNSTTPFQKGAMYIYNTSGSNQAYSFNLSAIRNKSYSFFIVHTSSQSNSGNTAGYPKGGPYCWVLNNDSSGNLQIGHNMWNQNYLWTYTWYNNQTLIPNEQLLPSFNVNNVANLTIHLPFLVSGVADISTPSTKLTVRTPNSYTVQGINSNNMILTSITNGYIGLGAASYWTPYIGYVAEVIFYDRILSITEQKQIEGYLLRKWFSGECS